MERLQKHMNHNDTDRYIDVLPRVVNDINNSVSVATGMRPIDVTAKNRTHYFIGYIDPKRR